jgi:hypothetical protein
MTCTFDLGHYRELVEAARQGGYRFTTFEERPRDGDLFLRHDVDLDLAAALEVAELEADAGARATYFLMSESVFYNLASSEGAATLARLRELGHAVGLHAVYPNVTLDDRFDSVVSWHNPDPEVMSRPISGVTNAYAEPWFAPENYRSDSNQRWRNGCPHKELRAHAFPWLQLLTHPEIWVYPGDTMGATMRAMLDSERERRVEQLRADAIDIG